MTPFDASLKTLIEALRNATAATLLDLSQDDVHQGGPMSKISTKKRDALSGNSFALPAQRKYPINDAAHVRNAAARLEQEKKAGKISDADYTKARARIARAAKKFGVASEYNNGGSSRVHVRADIAHGGSLHVRHMGDSDVFLDGVVVELADGEGKRVWIQIAKPGTFKGHPAGPFTLDGKTFDEIIRNFKATENKAIPIDFEHASEADPTQGSIPVDGAPAQGWIHDLKIEGGSLWGLVEWLPRARELIRAGQYKYFSPAIRFGARDRVTGQQIGARMTSGALTNNPFLDGMKPLAASDRAGGVVTLSLAHHPNEYMPRLRAILGLSDVSTGRECADAFDKLRDHFDAAGGDPNGSHEGIGLAKFCYSMRDLVGAQPGMTWDEIFEIIEELIEAATDAPPSSDVGAAMDDDEDDTGMSDRSRQAAILNLKIAGV